MTIQQSIPNPHDRGEDEWLTPKEAAEYLGLSYSTLAHYRSLGGGPIFYKFGWRVAYTKADLLAWRRWQRWSSTSKKLDD